MGRSQPVAGSVRAERPGDGPGIGEVLVDAFPTDAEARLVARLRGVARPQLSLVAVGGGAYYPRFGFRPAWELGLYYGRPGANPSFMVAELEPSALRGRSGEVRYHSAFSAL